MRTCFRSSLAVFSIIIFGAGAPSGAVADETSGQYLMPVRSETTITGASGRKYLTVPYRIFIEYGKGFAKSDPNPLGVVDIETDRVTIGADFITASPWVWGATLSFTQTSDKGSSPLAASIVTDKDISGGSLYLARPFAPNWVGGVSLSYSNVDGRAIYNGAAVVTENTESFGVSPFVNYSRSLGGGLTFGSGARISYSSAETNYVANVPPTGSTDSTVLHIPVSLSKRVPGGLGIWEFSGSATLNQEISRDFFPNVPQPDETTVTVGLGASYNLFNATAYVRGGYDLFDSAYESYSFVMGLSWDLR